MVKECITCGQDKSDYKYSRLTCRDCRNAEKAIYNAEHKKELYVNICSRGQRVMSQAPQWLKDADIKGEEWATIMALYEEAWEIRDAGGDAVVDHIAPLNGRGLFCGLHVEWNLQILTRHENGVKHTKYDTDQLISLQG